ncbi:class I tRNA ligase family protein [Patescibacteria group bacterium]|nr:class I tRNA ligase family protein [Patescibacteria group bacterium]MBU1757943.1 class I tRNA ligase family protein [Patescibacteria group bacterium]
MGNILQNLDDIDNMVEVKTSEYEIPVCKKTGEKLQTMCLVQRFLNIEKGKEQLHAAIAEQKIQTYPVSFLAELDSKIDTVSRRCISKNYLFGQQLPIWISEKK